MSPCTDNTGISTNTLSTHVNKLVLWLDSHGWSGWDPYDLWDNPLGIWMMSRKSFPAKAAGYVMSAVEERWPLTLRQLFRVKPQINPKAMGLFAAAFLDLERMEGEQRKIGSNPAYLQCFQWLDNNRVVIHGGCGWGYPFDWRSRILIPRNTPTVVNSAIIGDAYWLLYKYHGNEQALQRCEEICQFILNGLNRTGQDKDGSFCFSYTPVDSFQVHNANLFGAEFLCRIGKETGRQNWVDTGLSAGRFSLKEIRGDGTLSYWSEAQSLEGLQQDTYHSGFEIRALDGIATLTGNLDFRTAANNYFSAWQHDFFSVSGVPCFSRGNHDVIEVHSCAESLLCVTQMYKSGQMGKDEMNSAIHNICSAAIEHLWVDKGTIGYFASQNSLKSRRVIDIPFIRWGEAWMLRALATVQLIQRQILKTSENESYEYNY